jgi:nucleotide-binding universal stress UspA family protein
VPRNEIIVGLDDSPSGRAALRWAGQHALQAGPRLRAIHVLDWPYSFSSAPPGVDATPNPHSDPSDHVGVPDLPTRHELPGNRALRLAQGIHVLPAMSLP